MKHYKEYLLSKLSNSGWELIEEDCGCDWWLESTWRIQSTRESYGLEMSVLFLIDPMCNVLSLKSRVQSIEAHTEVIPGKPLGDSIADAVLMKGKIDKNIDGFMEDVNLYRNSVCS